LALALTAHTQAAPGNLDSQTFGTGTGVVFNADVFALGGIALQPDGKTVLAGTYWNGTNNDFYVARYLPDGTLDTSFGNSGKVSTAIGPRNDYARGVVLQPDGRIIVAGTCATDTDTDKFCVARYLADGATDTTFNTTGKIITAIGSGSDMAATVSLQPDGKIVVAGYCAPAGGYSYSFCLARYLPNGSIDPSFNNSGKVITACGTGISQAYSLSLLPDGKIILAGKSSDGVTNKGCVVRYLRDGAVDPSFNTVGIVSIGIGPRDFSAVAIVAQFDGKIVVAGTCQKDNTSYFCLARYLANGELDTTFNGTGTLITTLGSNGAYDIGRAAALALQPDGKILVAGSCYQGNSTYFCLARYLSNGTLDSTFGTGGTTISLVGTTSFALNVALQPDGKIIVGGSCTLSLGKNGTCLARYQGGPNPPKTLTEYVYAPLNYYFLTSRDADKASLDAAPGWARTGQSFSSLTFAESGTQGISRFYFDQIAKNQTRGSHFYTLVNSEKSTLNTLNPTNQALPRLPLNEGVDSYAFSPVVEGVGGSCAAGQTPVYRIFRGQTRFPDDPNHRFTTSLALYNQLVAEGWDGEGVKMCAPN